ncbi:SpaA isopeptide-forming pilin-related protein [uncultured Ruminococcus sp.]|uniref:SpaA isopeptide-forming pilin-related protein n=1 Tax=uncultured Ruminococcus sp. TaxID=165186 RepID=UPI00266507BE|nr:SpaA isopeptide-forming pilin-related protein [uncultured Ruminococcus sp.]
MKRWRKVLSGLLMAALIATGIALPEKTYAASEGMDGLKTVVNSGVGKMVDDKSTIDGSYDFAPIIGADTKITFGSTDGTMWDNTFCTKGQEHAKIITQWWPLADIGASGNTRSFTPYESLKGKMYAEYTNVGNANGLPVTMRIWFLDWQNTVVSNGYKNEVGADIDAVIVAKDNTKGGATPVIDIKGLKWIKVKFAYYDPDGNPLNVKGHFTLTDLDYAQGFYIESGVDSIYVTKEADARLVYDPRTEAIWSAHKGSNSDNGTSPDNSEGWVTYTYEGDSQTMVFYNGGTIQNVDGPGKGLTTVQSYPKDFTFTGGDAIFNGWKGSSKTESQDWHAWNTSEFGYTADMVMHQTKNVDLVIKKKDATTAEALKGAEFTVYKLKNGQWEPYTKAVWQDDYKEYMALNLSEADTENGKFKVVETKNPAGYTGSWEKEFTATDEGVVTLTLDVTNTRKTGQITITKTGENNKKLAGAVFDIKAAADIKSVGGTTLVVAGTVVDTVTTDANGTATSKELELGNYIVQETTAPAGYVLDTTEHNVTLDDSHTTVNVAVQNLTITVENDYTKLDLAKVDSSTGENLSGAKLSLLDANGKLVESWTSGSTPHRIEKMKPGKYTLREDEAPANYKIADPITFTLESKADVQTIKMEDLRYADLTIVKRIKASDITWAHGNPTFIFTVKGKDINGKDRTFQDYVVFTESYVSSHTDSQGYVELSVTWDKIPVGEDYTVSEQRVMRYFLKNVTGTDNVKVTKLKEPSKDLSPDETFSVHANLITKPSGTKITFENEKYDWGTTSHTTSVKNIIPLQ